MLVSHRKRFIYTKTKKTAGTSVEIYFEPYCAPEGEWSYLHLRDSYEGKAGVIGARTIRPGETGRWYNHMPAAEIRARIGDSMWKEYFKFCVVRNPFDRLVSAFHFELLVHRAKDDPTITVDRLDEGLPELLSEPDERDFREFRVWLHLPRSLRYMDRDAYAINGELCVDFVIRYESLLDGLKHVCDRVGVPFDPSQLRRLKSGFRPPGCNLSNYYDAGSIARVSDLYRFELETFGYAPPR